MNVRIVILGVSWKDAWEGLYAFATSALREQTAEITVVRAGTTVGMDYYISTDALPRGYRWHPHLYVPTDGRMEDDGELHYFLRQTDGVLLVGREGARLSELADRVRSSLAELDMRDVTLGYVRPQACFDAAVVELLAELHATACFRKAWADEQPDD